MIRFPDISTMPRALAEKLLTGTCGRNHLLDASECAMQLFRRCDTVEIMEYQSLARSLALAAWEADPLDGMLAEQVLRLHRAGQKTTLVPEIERVLTTIATGWSVPQGAQGFMNLMRQRDFQGAREWLEQELASAPDQLWLLRQAVLHGFFEGTLDWTDRVLEKAQGSATFPLLVPLFARLRGEAALMGDDPENALHHFDKSHEFLPLPGTLERSAEGRRRLGDTVGALDALACVMEARPWHVSGLLGAYDLATGVSEARQAPEGRGSVLFYTFNKARELDLALAALAASELYGARVVVLDNGSTDDTARVVAGWAKRMGCDANGTARLESVRLPVNVGAPAARNWLASLDNVQRCDWVAYMDDDALVEPDWLGRFGAAMRAYPQAGAWGARVMDHEHPQVFQSVDLFFLESPQAGEGVDVREQRHFRMSGLQHQVLDLGQFRHMRPCGSVTGCVHLFRTERLRSTGGFDVRFSPSQYDDLDHDLRLCLDGAPPVFHGHLHVRHMKRTGKGIRFDSDNAGPLGNMYKLQSKHSPNDMQTLRNTVFTVILSDFQKKSAFFHAVPTRDLV